MKLNIADSFAKELPSDNIHENYCRQVVDACFSYVNPTKTKAPECIHVSKEVLSLLGLSEKDAASTAFLNVFTGNAVYEGTHPYAMCYGGHQFGNWAGQLGDGRAINLFEVLHNNNRFAVQLKGAGKTPYSRNADGLAVLRSSIREYLCSEAMFHLKIPTTRGLSLSLSGDEVLRDVMYNGNAAYEKGAIVCRVAQSFVRFGNFEILAAKKNIPALKQLADYVIVYFFKEITTEGKQKYIDFLTIVRDKTIDMIIHWLRVGFVHGVMNTDNMSILGLTIDYGPYGWLDGYDQDFTPNTTDAAQKRYRFSNQAYIGMWNLFKLVNALYPIIEQEAPLQDLVNEFEALYYKKYAKMMSEKLGIFSKEIPEHLIDDLETNLQLIETDYTIFFRNLATVVATDHPKEAIAKIKSAIYHINLLEGNVLKKWEAWFLTYLSILKKEVHYANERVALMNSVNPKYIFRNYMAQLAIDAAEKADYSLINEFYELLKNPYNEQSKFEKWFAKRPEWARHKIGCSMLSCSS